MGNVPSTYVNGRPLLRCSNNNHTRIATRIMAEMRTTLVGSSGAIPSAIKDSSGRPNGSTQEANCRLPTSRSNSLDVATPATNSAFIRVAYLVTFAGSKRHTFDCEQ